MFRRSRPYSSCRPLRLRYVVKFSKLWRLLRSWFILLVTLLQPKFRRIAGTTMPERHNLGEMGVGGRLHVCSFPVACDLTDKVLQKGSPLTFVGACCEV